MIDFFEFSNEMFCLADRRGYFTRVNQAWTKTLGWSAEELISRPYFDFVHPDDLAATVREAELLQSGSHETISFENRYRCQDGSYRWLSWRAVLAREPQQLVATARDITAQKAAEKSLQESEERFRAFMDNSQALAWAKDEQGRYVYLNKAYEERFHVRIAEWLGKTDFDVWPKDIAQLFWDNDRQVLASGEPLQVTEPSLSPQNEKCFWLITKFLFLDSQKRRFVGGVAVEITALMATEQALRAERELLRNLIDVQEKERQFLCHEFHDGLIQYAVGSLMLLEGSRSNPAPADSSAIIEKVIASLRKGVEDGRRVIRGIQPPLLDDSGLEAALEDLIGQFAASGIMVTSKCDAEIDRLPDSVQTTIYRVIQEAINNAQKHSNTDVVRIELKKTAGVLHLDIRDFGCGFDVKSVRKGGFGLLGMRERVRLLGGECLIDSELDAGTHISIRLPIAERADGT